MTQCFSNEAYGISLWIVALGLIFEYEIDARYDVSSSTQSLERQVASTRFDARDTLQQ